MLQTKYSTEVCLFIHKKDKKEGNKKQNQENFERNSKKEFVSDSSRRIFTGWNGNYPEHKTLRFTRATPSGFKRVSSIFTSLLISVIKFYQKAISPYLPRTCRFYPTCSNYAIEALKSKGLIKGTFMSIWRILRCNPFSKGGYDPVR